MDSNHRRLSQQIYSLPPLTAREPHHSLPYLESEISDFAPRSPAPDSGSRTPAVGCRIARPARPRAAARRPTRPGAPARHLGSETSNLESQMRHAAMEPAGRVELPTSGLQNRCSTVELRRPAEMAKYTGCIVPFKPRAPKNRPDPTARRVPLAACPPVPRDMPIAPRAMPTRRCEGVRLESPPRPFASRRASPNDRPCRANRPPVVHTISLNLTTNPRHKSHPPIAGYFVNSAWLPWEPARRPSATLSTRRGPLGSPRGGLPRPPRVGAGQPVAAA